VTRTSPGFALLTAAIRHPRLCKIAAKPATVFECASMSRTDCSHQLATFAHDAVGGVVGSSSGDTRAFCKFATVWPRNGTPTGAALTEATTIGTLTIPVPDWNCTTDKPRRAATVW